ncbi:acyl-CoA dehydrogenase family protein [Sphingomonas sp. CGMCC 1.13654]|uniref:Acyl-CoA dehydrogenase family protein n=1 Tax=Sphingomonas chungangi TaxID=2683589 RepID=A0A838L8J1_9SPHN|nr:acyl-CoA dehydrogenase family protein [Sphingomonas chungangi]MBA2933848.1 acyl-CoA dehydrogenase family protein [Sphingomonas chungangi]MVW55178.1 acyl-CoA dehydrogenase [Sphingomonas chungangi]
MDLRLSDADRAFQAEVQRFFAHDYPQAILTKARAGQVLTRADHVASQQALQSRGWLGVGWPTEHSGPGWTPVQRYLFDEELERAGAPNLIPMAILYIGPIICAFGTPEQQSRWLPDILESRAMWAQGYSEPEAGSDLASLRFNAERDGDDYVLNGTKIWTTGAHWADWIFCLARTSAEPRRQDGISLICADMRSPGISVHPIITIDGSHELNRVEFVDVRVPVENRIGEEGRAWHYANVLLQAERLSYAHIARKRMDLAKIRALARHLLDDPAFARRLATVEIEVEALEIAVLRALAGEATPAAVSALKILCTECAQHVTELFVELAGRHALPMLDRRAANWADAAPLVPEFAPQAIQSYLFERAQTIYGGATEVQKTIVWRGLAGRNA